MKYLIVRRHTAGSKGLRLKVQHQPSGIEKATSFLALLSLMSLQASGTIFNMVNTFYLLKGFKAQSEPAESVVKNRSEDLSTVPIDKLPADSTYSTHLDRAE